MKLLFVLLTSLASSSAYATTFNCHFKDLITSEETWLASSLFQNGNDILEKKVNTTAGQYKIQGEVKAQRAWGRTYTDISLMISNNRGPIASLNSSQIEQSKMQIFSDGKPVGELNCSWHF